MHRLHKITQLSLSFITLMRAHLCFPPPPPRSRYMYLASSDPQDPCSASFSRPQQRPLFVTYRLLNAAYWNHLTEPPQPFPPPIL
ncbi:hypothetical protein DER44DRAFT_776153 [Fusarium oxysporum]|nr:hypothetical protein DER44DRAFT_776153 [Fusarium oxysporum]